MAETLTLEIVAKLVDEATKPIEGIAGSFGKLTGAFALGQLAANGVGDAIHAMTGFVEDSIKSAEQEQDTLAQLNAVIKSTGSQAGITADQAIKLAESLQKTTTYSHDTILGVEDLEMTFTSISSKILPQTTTTILDMATALHEDLKSATIQVGKAMQDPVLGMTALRRVGVAFSEDQKQVIKDLVDTGKSAEAQQLILKELNKEFGGSAAAAAQTYSGRMQQLSNDFEDVKQKIGLAVLNGIAPLQAKLIEFVSSDKFQAWVQQATAWIQDNLPKAIDYLVHTVWPNLVAAFKDAYAIGSVLLDFYMKHKDAVNTAAGMVLAFVVAYKILQTTLAVTSAIQAAISIFGALAGQLIATGGVITGTTGLLTTLEVLAATPLAPVAIAIVGIALIYEAINALRELKGAEDAASAAEANANAGYDKMVKDARAQYAAGKISKARLDAVTEMRASGGPVESNTPYIVGEKGPELFVPSGNGMIVPNDKLGSAGGGSSVTNIYGDINLSSSEAVKEFFKKLGRNQELAAHGLTTAGY